MGLFVLFLYVLGCGLLAYGLSLIFHPLLYVTAGAGCLTAALVARR